MSCIQRDRRRSRSPRNRVATDDRRLTLIGGDAEGTNGIQTAARTGRATVRDQLATAAYPRPQ